MCVVLLQIAKHRPTKAIYNELVASSPLGTLRSEVTAGILSLHINCHPFHFHFHYYFISMLPCCVAFTTFYSHLAQTYELPYYLPSNFFHIVNISLSFIFPVYEVITKTVCNGCLGSILLSLIHVIVSILVYY